MSKSKFKVGDTVRILDGSKIKGYTGGWFSHMTRHVGKITTIESLYLSPDSQNSCLLEGSAYRWDERGLELVKPEKIIIFRNGAEVIAKNTATGKTGVARCNPADEFDFNTGAKLAFERLTAPEPEKPKYYSGKIVCVSGKEGVFTKGKVYTVKDGTLLSDDGLKHPFVTLPYESVQDINERSEAEFIELIE